MSAATHGSLAGSPAAPSGDPGGGTEKGKYGVSDFKKEIHRLIKMIEENSLVERSKLIFDRIDFKKLREAKISRTLENYFLNISYPPLQAMKEIELEDQRYVFDNIEISDKVALYIHIPFCHSSCSYCHYYKVLEASKRTIKEYLDALAIELSIYSDKFGKLRTQSIYVGGGTPSYLDLKDIRYLFF